jgi:hypothetical protein
MLSNSRLPHSWNRFHHLQPQSKTTNKKPLHALDPVSLYRDSLFVVRCQTKTFKLHSSSALI